MKKLTFNSICFIFILSVLLSFAFLPYEEFGTCTTCADDPQIENTKWCHHFGANNLCMGTGVTCDSNITYECDPEQ